MSQQTDWESSSKWYDSIVGKEGHYYHQHVILPKLIPLLDLKKSSSLLDLGCGQGVLARHLPQTVEYVGADLAPSLIKLAKKEASKNHSFVVADICKPLPIEKRDFTHALFMLSFQNLAQPDLALKNASDHLVSQGILCLVLNHPCFRIPRQSHWEIDAQKKLQYRRVDSYLSPMQIPIQTHPGKKEASKTYSFHYPLSLISRFLALAGFRIILLDEWASDKKSTGKAAQMENRARREFPLFLAIKAEKK